MFFLNKEIVFYIIFLPVVLPCCLSAQNAEGSGNELSDLVQEIQYFSSQQELPVSSVEKNSNVLFKEFTSYEIPANDIFWFRITLDNKRAKGNEYFIHFNGLMHEVHLYQKNTNGKWSEHVGGLMVPEKMKAAKGYIADKVPFTILEGEKNVIYLKIRNSLPRYVDISKVKCVDKQSFYRLYSRTKQVQSLFLGVIVILCFFNLLLYVFTQTRIYLYYLLYAAFSSLYFIHFFRYFESGFFVNHPEINVYFFFSVTIIQAIYCWFLYEVLKTEVAKKTLTRIRQYANIVTAVTFVILMVALVDFTTGVILSDILSVSNSLFILAIVFLLFKKVSNTGKIILTGSLFLVVGAFLALLLNFKNDIPVHIYLYQAGFFIELIFFTVAINFMYYNERLENIKIELKNSILVNEKLVKEREAQNLREQLHLKERDLATKAVVISQKETLIKSVTSQLKKQIENNSVKTKDIKNVISDLSSKINTNYREEFETHFVKVHPGFYQSLNKKYPGLTITERRLCAFIKLNLSTKEIAAITKRNPESIHMTRSRLRKKMGLKKEENLENIISAIN